MKKIFAVFIFCAALLMSITAAAQGVSVNGRELEFSEATGIPYVNADDRTMIPLRTVSENLGADVRWVDDEQCAVISKDKTEIRAYVGERYIIVNGEKKETDTETVEKDGRTYLPVRYIAEALGCTVIWFDYRSEAIILDEEYSEAYREFEDMFDYDGTLSGYAEVIVVNALYKGEFTVSEMSDYWKNLSSSDKKLFITLVTMEKLEKNPEYAISIAFQYKDSDDKPYYLATSSSFSYDIKLYNPFETEKINPLN